MTYYQPGRIGPADRPRNTTPRNTRAGWWFWGPFIFGMGFFVFGILFLAGAAVVPAGSGGLAFTAITFLVIGVASLAVAAWAWRDIHSDDGPPEIPGTSPQDLEAELRITGISGQATINGVKYLAGTSYQGSTLVELQLDVTTVKGGNVPITTQSRVPLPVAERVGVGATVPVIISSTDPSKLIIEWTELLPAPSTPPPAPTPPPATTPPAQPGAQ
jgi:hypothetical protein